MTQQFAVPEPQLAAPRALAEPLYVRLGDAVVIISATLVSLAAGAWLIAQIGFDLSYAILVALATYCALLVLHLFMRRNLTGKAEPGLDESDVHWQTGAAAFEAALSRRAAKPDTHSDSLSERLASRAPEPDEMQEEQEQQEEAAPRARSGWSEALPLPVPDEPEGAQAFRFRPSRIPYFESGEETDVRPAREPAAPLHEAPTGALSPDINVEVIQDLIKKLADELNGPPAREAASGAASDPGVSAEAMLGRSVAALDAAARAMRAEASEAPPALAAPGRRGSEGRGDPPAGWPIARDERRDGGPPPLDSQLARIAEAVAAERFDVLIEPIHALSEGRPRHYEVTMRLRTADGTTMEQADYTRAALSSDLLPHIDAARMLRAARVARRLAERGRHGSVLSAMSGDSITDNGFLDAAAQETANDGRVRLVLAFSQSDARAFTPAHAEALGAMAAAGFSFALEDVTDLEMDFGKLKALGFEFVKLDAQVFLDGLQAPGGCIPASDICHYLAESGLTLIVGAIEDDWLLAKVMGFGVLLGKGTLFGGPRLIKPVEPGSAAA
jgi:cyclic-di-GMP phosphodiesterase TipF (flagellum assembly factor)